MKSGEWLLSIEMQNHEMRGCYICLFYLVIKIFCNCICVNGYAALTYNHVILSLRYYNVIYIIRFCQCLLLRTDCFFVMTTIPFIIPRMYMSSWLLVLWNLPLVYVIIPNLHLMSKSDLFTKYSCAKYLCYCVINSCELLTRNMLLCQMHFLFYQFILFCFCLFQTATCMLSFQKWRVAMETSL